MYAVKHIVPNLDMQVYSGWYKTDRGWEFIIGDFLDVNDAFHFINSFIVPFTDQYLVVEETKQ